MSSSSENRRLRLRQLQRWSALGLLCCISPIVPSPAVSQPNTQPIATDSVCRGIEPVSTQHPDVQTLQSLAKKYAVTLPVTIAWDGASITSYEIGQVVALLLQQGQTLNDADRQTLQQLAERYRLTQDNAQSGNRYNVGAGQQRFMSKRLPQGTVVPNLPLMAAPAPATSAMPRPSNMPRLSNDRTSMASETIAPMLPPPTPPSPQEPWREPRQPSNTEGYSVIDENPFLPPASHPLSTFAIDVDTASYSNVRHLINQGVVPPKDAVRLEEFINYFPYRYNPPQGDQPFSVNTAVTPAPWNTQHHLVRIGLQGQQLKTLPPSNLVFLLDVSGSMNSPDKLPLLKQSMCLLVNQLTAQDQVAIVVYAGSAGLVLPPTAGDQTQKIMAAIDALEAGGSTAGGEGIELAYNQAQKALIKGGNNRVILATDGDFNVGPSSDAELVRMIEQKRQQGVFLTVLGFGTGNYKDNKMEQLANKGNGNYAYLDTLSEAKKVLVQDIRGTLFTIAKDVKIQVEFNPAKIQAYRLIGYENRALRDQDFNDDTKDAGEIGAGHRVTALYEVIPTGVKSDIKLPAIDALKYQTPANQATQSTSNELMQVKLRYKAPDSDTSKLLVQPILDQISQGDSDFQFSSAVALFGMVLRDSNYKGQAGIPDVLRLAQAGRSNDPDGYRAEFIRLVERYASIRDQPDNTNR